MSASITKLNSLLSAQQGMVEELIGLLKQEESSIARLDMEQLEAVGEKKRELFVDLENSGNDCRQLMKQLASELRIPETGTLSLLLEKIAQPHREPLQALQRQLLELKVVLDTSLSRNRELLVGAFNSANRSLEFFKNIFTRSTTYGGAGQMVGTAANARIIRKEI